MRRRSVFFLGIAVVIALLASTFLFACSNEDDGTVSGSIGVVTREDGSGTRGAFVELFAVQTTNADGKKIDAIATGAVTTSSTSVMMTTVSGDKRAIGYISLGSLNDTVKALEIDGAAATAENVKNGSYKISRPFLIVTKGSPNAAAQDFINFIMSKEGQKIIVENNYIAVDDKAPAYSKDNAASGKVVVAGSSSVSPVMEKLKEAYAKTNPSVTIEIQTSDSSAGISSTIDGICDIGMASRALKDTEAAAGLTSKTIAIDGIAVIVNNKNPFNGLTKEQVCAIFLGDIVKWEDVES